MRPVINENKQENKSRVQKLENNLRKIGVNVMKTYKLITRTID